MKSIDQISQGVIRSTELSTVETGRAVSLPPRDIPLSTLDIEKIETAISRQLVEVQKPKYGSVPVLDQSGNIYKYEFGVIGYDTQFEIGADIDPRLLAAMQRPAPSAHIVYHLTRLAAHLRDTRGNILTAVLEDIAQDLRGVSEWAVVKACKELRLSQSRFFPPTGELVETVKRHQRAIDRAVQAGKNVSI